METQAGNGALTVVSDEQHEADTAGLEQEPHSVRTRFMFALAAKHEVVNVLRTQAESSWKTRLPAILVRWEQLRSSVAQLELGDSAFVNQVTVEPLSSEFDEIVQRYTTDHRFATAFERFRAGSGSSRSTSSLPVSASCISNTLRGSRRDLQGVPLWTDFLKFARRRTAGRPDPAS